MCQTNHIPIFFFLQSLGVLINLVEHSPGNAKVLVQTKTKCSYDSQNSEEDSIDVEAEVIGLEALTQVGRCSIPNAAFRLTCRLRHCCFDGDICTTEQAPCATERKAASSVKPVD